MERHHPSLRYSVLQLVLALACIGICVLQIYKFWKDFSRGQLPDLYDLLPAFLGVVFYVLIYSSHAAEHFERCAEEIGIIRVAGTVKRAALDLFGLLLEILDNLIGIVIAIVTFPFRLIHLSIRLVWHLVSWPFRIVRMSVEEILFYAHRSARFGTFAGVLLALIVSPAPLHDSSRAILLPSAPAREAKSQSTEFIPRPQRGKNSTGLESGREPDVSENQEKSRPVRSHQYPAGLRQQGAMRRFRERFGR